MSAYFQNQLIMKNKAGEDEIRVYSETPFDFLLSQKITSFGSKSIVEQLMLNSNKDKTAKVFCVCDYDRAVYKDDARHYYHLNKNDAEEVNKACFVDTNGFKLVVENSQHLTNPHYLPKEDCSVQFEGYIVNADKNECISMSLASEVSAKVYNKHQTNILSPLSLLTRKGREAMGGGDIYFIGANADQLADISGRWYNDNLYWTDEAPKTAEDITQSSLWYFDASKSDEERMQLASTCN